MTVLSLVRDLPVPEQARWQPLRAGLQNVWEYEDQRFVFHHGRLLLRGRNEAGKSKALELLLPFLLDANLSPARLDPFGSGSRHMKWNLLNDANPDQETNAGYVWLELGRLGDAGAEYVTLGAGLKARRSAAQVDAWYFVSELRPDEGLHLFDEGRAAVSRRRLGEVLGDAGLVFERAADYRHEVNRRLFGMPELQYEALLGMLLQLRRPQLAKQLEPAELSRILTQSLPPLDPRMVGRLAEGFERLDRHRQEREEWQRTLAAVLRFLQVYGRYVRAHARARAGALTGAESRCQKARAELRAQEAAVEAGAAQVSACMTRLRELEAEAEALTTRHDTLLSSDAYRAAQQLADAQKRADTRAEEAGRAEASRLAEETQREEAVAAQEEAAAAVRIKQAEVGQLREAAGVAARAAALAEAHGGVEALLEGAKADAARSILREVLARREAELAELEKLAGAAERAQGEVAKAEARARAAEAHHGDAAARHGEARAALGEETARFDEALLGWFEGAQVLQVAEAQRVYEAPISERAGLARALAEPLRRDLDARAAMLSVRREGLEAEEARVREERRLLAEAPHPVPAVPAWRTAVREGRPGAGLYLLCDFAEGVPEKTRIALEAALESSGLLDAWVTPSGEVLDGDTFELVLRAGEAPAEGRTLAEALVPTPTGGVPAEVVLRVLESVALVGAGDPAPAAAGWIAEDGRWGLGPLRGAWQKAHLAYVGETAREAERRRRMALLAGELERLEAELRQCTAEFEAVQAQGARLEAELRAFPSHQKVLEAQADEAALGRAAADALERARSAGRALDSARGLLEQALSARDRRAAALGLAGWCAALGELRAATRTYREAAQEAVAETRALGHLGERLGERQATVDGVDIRLGNALRNEAHLRREANACAAEAAALHERLGATAEEIVQTLAQLEARRTEVAVAQRAEGERRSRLDREHAAAAERAATAATVVGTRESERAAALAAFVRLALAGLLETADLAPEGDPAHWTLTDGLGAARRVQEQVGALAYDDHALDAAADRVTAAQRELGLAVSSGVRIASRTEDRVLVYDGALHGRECTLLALRDEVQAEVAERDRLLAADDRELFESFLAGETHEHLRERLNEAHAMVGRMNQQLGRRATAGGMVIKLDWAPEPNAPAGAVLALKLLLRSPKLLAAGDREALSSFLRQRLEEARGAEAGGSLEDRMMHALDYRGWYRFEVLFRNAAGAWSKLTRKAHGAGSGGQKAVMLHLPLFAAAAAFYDSAREGAPRLVLLDEAFAGIDRPMRAQLMGLLAEFELDFLMTSFDEWGFYAELDGLATYQLTREPGLEGVLAERFLWDGFTAHEQGVA